MRRLVLGEATENGDCKERQSKRSHQADCDSNGVREAITHGVYSQARGKP
jgi:hypothetical protein